MQKLFNFILAIIFISLVILFAYKTVSKPQILSTSLHNSSVKEVDGVSDSYVGAAPHSKEELNAIIKEYILNNPDDIIKSLEGMQKKKVQDSANKASDYLEKNRSSIETENSPPILGNEKGDVSVVIFYDYNCSFCKKAHEHTKAILASDAGIKIVLRPIPILGGSSMYAAKVALAVQKISKEKFAAIHNDMMQMRTITEGTIKELLAKYDVDYAIVENEVNSYGIKQLISKNFELAKGLGIKGAPSYVINGKFIPGLIQVEQFKTIIMQVRSVNAASE